MIKDSAIFTSAGAPRLDLPAASKTRHKKPIKPGTSLENMRGVTVGQPSGLNFFIFLSSGGVAQEFMRDQRGGEPASLPAAAFGHSLVRLPLWTRGRPIHSSIGREAG